MESETPKTEYFIVGRALRDGVNQAQVILHVLRQADLLSGIQKLFMA